MVCVEPRSQECGTMERLTHTLGRTQSSVVSVGNGKAECLSPVEGEGVAMLTSSATLL